MKWWIEALVKILPAYVANTAPLICDHLKLDFLGLSSRPLDGGLELRDGTRLLGDGKTWLGLLTFPILGLLAGGLLTFTGMHTPLTGLAMGLGAFLGDLGGSFLKRRFRMERGAKAGLLDQEDFITGAILVSLVWFQWPLGQLLLVYALTPLVHRTANQLGHQLGLKEVPW